MAIQDFTTDESLAFIHLLKEANALPDWLETIPESDDVQHLPSVAFADPFHRKMPIHNKAATFMSAVSTLVYDYPSEPSWERRLKAACSNYDITDEVKLAHKVLSTDQYQKKEATETPKRAYALELVVEPGKEATSYYPINTPDEIEDSALKLASDMFKEKLPGTWFAEAADAIMKAAAAHGVSAALLPSTVKRMAEDRLPSPEYLTEQLERRVKQAGIPVGAAEIYKEAALSAIDGEASALDAAHVWEFADRKFGVRYTDTVVSPVAAFRSGVSRDRFEKLAGEVVPIAGVAVPFTQFQLLPDRLIAAVLPAKTASVVLAAKAQEHGVKSGSLLNRMEESEQLKLLELLTENASA